MNELVTVGGVCFVAVEPETRNANTRTARTGTDKYGMIRIITESSDGEETSGAANGKRKYRARGERTRKEQRRAAWVKWYAKHKAERIAKSKEQRMSDPERYRAYQRKWREERKLKRLQRVTD